MENPHIVAAKHVAATARKLEQAEDGVARALDKRDGAQANLLAAIEAQKALSNGDSAVE